MSEQTVLILVQIAACVCLVIVGWKMRGVWEADRKAKRTE